MQLNEMGGPQQTQFTFAAAMAGATTSDEFIVFRAPTNLTLTGAVWVPFAAVTANGSNFSTLSVRNRKADWTGAALPFARSYAATNSVQGVPENMTVSGTAADVLVAAGDILTVQRIFTASGLIIPAGLVTIIFTGR